MIKLTFALCPLLALCAMAQEKPASSDAPANATEISAATSAQIEKIQAKLKAEAESAKLPVPQLQASAALKKYTEGSSGLCSIPLLEVPIPPGTNFTLRQLTPNLKNLAPMPQSKGPAPPCASTPH